VNASALLGEGRMQGGCAAARTSAGGAKHLVERGVGRGVIPRHPARRVGATPHLHPPMHTCARQGKRPAGAATGSGCHSLARRHADAMLVRRAGGRLLVVRHSTHADARVADEQTRVFLRASTMPKLDSTLRATLGLVDRYIRPENSPDPPSPPKIFVHCTLYLYHTTLFKNRRRTALARLFLNSVI